MFRNGMYVKDNTGMIGIIFDLGPYSEMAKIHILDADGNTAMELNNVSLANWTQASINDIPEARRNTSEGLQYKGY